eukprot:2731068-Pleurochrysis_carterae.AAC.1
MHLRSTYVNIPQHLAATNAVVINRRVPCTTTRPSVLLALVLFTPSQSVSMRYKSSKKGQLCEVEMTSKCNNVQGSIEAILSQPVSS